MLLNLLLKTIEDLRKINQPIIQPKFTTGWPVKHKSFLTQCTKD